MIRLCGIVLDFRAQSADINGQGAAVDIVSVAIPELAENLFRREDDIGIFQKKAQQFILAGRQIQRRAVLVTSPLRRLTRIPLELSSVPLRLKFSLLRRSAFTLERKIDSLNGLVM